MALPSPSPPRWGFPSYPCIFLVPPSFSFCTSQSIFCVNPFLKSCFIICHLSLPFVSRFPVRYLKATFAMGFFQFSPTDPFCFSLLWCWKVSFPSFGFWKLKPQWSRRHASALYEITSFSNFNRTALQHRFLKGPLTRFLTTNSLVQHDA